MSSINPCCADIVMIEEEKFEAQVPNLAEDQRNEDPGVIGAISNGQSEALALAQFDIESRLEAINLPMIVEESRAMSLSDQDTLVCTMSAVANDLMNGAKEEEKLLILRKNGAITERLVEHLVEEETAALETWTVSQPMACFLFEYGFALDEDGDPFSALIRKNLFSAPELSDEQGIGNLLDSRMNELIYLIESSPVFTAAEKEIFRGYVNSVTYHMATSAAERLFNPEKVAESLKTFFKAIKPDRSNFDDVYYMNMEEYHRVMMHHQKALLAEFGLVEKAYTDPRELFTALYEAHCMATNIYA